MHTCLTGKETRVVKTARYVVNEKLKYGWTMNLTLTIRNKRLISWWNKKKSFLTGNYAIDVLIMIFVYCSQKHNTVLLKSHTELSKPYGKITKHTAFKFLHNTNRTP